MATKHKVVINVSDPKGRKANVLRGADVKPAAKKKDPEAKEPEPVAKEYTFTEVRTFLADKSRAGHTAEIKKILAAHGADKLSDLDKAEYAVVMAEPEEILAALSDENITKRAFNSNFERICLSE